MKKIIIGLSGLAVLAFVTVFVLTGQKANGAERKAKSEVTHDCSKCPTAATCASASTVTTVEPATCDTAKCKAAKCDPATCKKECKNAAGDMKCDPATCKKECSKASSEMKCDTTKCSMHKAGK